MKKDKDCGDRGQRFRAVFLVSAAHIYDENGALVASYTYDAWGNHTVTNYTSDNIGNINPFRYRGYYFDSETGFYYLNTRYYNPQLKRFINADSLSYLGANGDMQAFNLYAYCSNNPVMFVDPLGTYSWSEFWEDTKKVVNVIKNNISFEAGICIGMSFENNINIFAFDFATRSDIIGIQYKNGEWKFGHPNKSSFAAGLSLGSLSILFGPRNEGFESNDYSERDYEYLGNFDVSVSIGKGLAFVLGAHLNLSFSISGFANDIKEEF